MALPTLTNQSVGSVELASIKAAINTTLRTQITALATVKTNSTATTANLASDTIIYRADGAIWDDTCSCWVSVDLTEHRPTPRNQDGI